MTEAQIQQRAARLLREAGITVPPVDVDRIAQLLNVEIRREHADDEVSGALYRLPTGAVLGVNSSHPPLRQRFTIAHEIGHLVLHELPVFLDRVYPASSITRSTEPRYKRNRLSSAAVDPIEIEANRFAACLLMPRQMLISRLAEESLPLGSPQVEKLAGLFNVSVQAMTFRLTNLAVPLEVA